MQWHLALMLNFHFQKQSVSVWNSESRVSSPTRVISFKSEQHHFVSFKNERAMILLSLIKTHFIYEYMVYYIWYFIYQDETRWSLFLTEREGNDFIESDKDALHTWIYDILWYIIYQDETQWSLFLTGIFCNNINEERPLKCFIGNCSSFAECRFG